MINVIEIENCQSHKHTTLDLHLGVNAIVGNSDSGKSAILRAIYWAIWNRPLGDDIRSTWGGETKVTLNSDDFEIVRGKGKDNYYKLGKHTFKAIKTDVPQEVVDALNINEINVQMQLDSHFLLADSAGEVAAHFNRIAHIDVIDKATKAVQKWVRSIEQDIYADERQLAESEVALKAYAELDTLDGYVSELEGLDQRRAQIISEAHKVEQLVNEINGVNVELTKYDSVLRIEGGVQKLLALGEQRRLLKSKYDSLFNTIEESKETEVETEAYSKVLKIEGDVGKLLELHNRAQDLISDKDELSKAIRRCKQADDGFESAKRDQDELQQEFDRSFPDVCPLCGQEVDR